MESKEGRQLHGQAEIAREKGNFLEALEFTDKATVAYQEDGDLLGLAEVQSSRQSIFKHLYRKTGDKNFLILEKHAAEAAVEIAQASGIKEALAIPYRNLGKYYEEAGEFGKAAEFFAKAVGNMLSNPPSMHNRPGVLADIRCHQHAAEYRNGDKTALARMEQVLKDLEQSGEEKVSSYNKNVWLSGAHLRIAEMLKGDDPQKAKVYLQKAKEIIDSDERLTLRKEQWEKISQDFPPVT